MELKPAPGNVVPYIVLQGVVEDANLSRILKKLKLWWGHRNGKQLYGVFCHPYFMDTVSTVMSFKFVTVFKSSVPY